MDDPWLDKILETAQNIKTEPEEIQEQYFPVPEDDQITITPFEPPEPPRFLNNNTQAKVETLAIEETDYIHKRAQDIKKREANNQNLSFYANVPPKPVPIVSQSTISPLTISAYNSQYGFQATTENVKQVAINANPYSHIPLVVQQTARRIGADLDKINSRDPRLQNKVAPKHMPERRQTTSFETAPSTSFEIPKAPTYTSPPPLFSPPIILKVNAKTQTTIPKIPEKKNAETQTTNNDGTLRFELTQQELMDLSSDKRDLLLKFKEVKFH